MKEKIPIIAIISILLFSAVSVSVMGSQPEVELPPTTHYVTMRATDGVNSWFDMKISDIPSGSDIANGTYLGWCAQKNIMMTRGVNHTVRLYSSYDPLMPKGHRSENWSKINYVLNHKQGDKESIQAVLWYYICLESYPSDPDAQAMIADADRNGSDFIPQSEEILAIIVDGVEAIQRSFFEYTLPSPSDEPSKPSSGSTGGSNQNHAPTADATAGEPYAGFARGEITFDGSRSYDRDGRIVTWTWDFGDGDVGSGKVVTHSYAAPGTYTVVLTVKDDKRATDTYTTTATLTAGNNPPSIPAMSGPQTGQKNTSYEFTAVSTDPDNDTLQYLFTWGDGESITTASVSSGTPMVQPHLWSEPGHYSITVKAADASTESGTATLTISIDVLDVEGLGYLIEDGSDGTYDTFYSNATGVTTAVEKLANGNYLLDTDGDGVWDYEYNPASGELGAYQEQLPMVEYAAMAIVLLIACGALFFVLGLKKKEKTKI